MKEEVLEAGVRCLLANRAAYGLSTLQIRTYSKIQGGNKTVTLADLSPATTVEMDHHFMANTHMGTEGRYPYSIDFPKRSIKSQNLIWSSVYGAERYHGREAALDFLIALDEENPEFPTVPLWRPFGGG